MQHPIRAVLVFADPSDWARDLQLIMDVVVSGGVPGGEPAANGECSLLTRFPSCASDLLLSMGHALPIF